VAGADSGGPQAQVHRLWTKTMFCVVLLHGLEMGLASEFNSYDWQKIMWDAFDNFFTLFYTIDVCLKLGTLGRAFFS
jgi:hypothetical protein